MIRKASCRHSDQLGSVRVVTGADGVSDREVSYRPFGEAVEVVTDPAALPETKGFIGERFDAEAGLQFLNARYYDPKLGLFVQPDWFEVTKAGVGTNRYAYSGNDPVNLSDPGGNTWEDIVSFVDRIFGGEGAKERQNQRYAEALGRAQRELDRFQNEVNAGNYDWLSHSAIEEALKARIDRVNVYSRRVRNGLGAAAVDTIIMGVSVAGLKAGALARSTRTAPSAIENSAIISQNARTGVVGEALIGVLRSIGPKTAIRVGGRTRIPDGLIPGKVLSEIKNVGKLSNTSQLRDMLSYAQQNSLRMDLYVRKTTVLSGPLQELIDTGAINLICILP